MSIMRIPIVSALALASVVAGCTANEGDDAKTQEARLPVVDDQRDDLILTWFASGGAQTGTSVSDVPAEQRKDDRYGQEGIEGSLHRFVSAVLH